MICTSCRCPSPFRNTGLCSACRAIAHAPKLTHRPARAAKRFLAPEYSELRHALGMNPEKAVRKSELIFRELRLVLPARVIHNWNLDNPYMATHARRAMVSYILRFAFKSADARARKPVQSERSTRKAVAA